jgi:tetratricopeptide (TPR) repeat protein
VFILTKALFKDRTSAFWIALIFAVHPYKVESVSWIIQRKDLLYTMFFLSGVLTYIKYIRTDRLFWYLITILLAYLAIISKVAAVTFIMILFLIEFFINEKISLKKFVLLVIIGLIQISIKLTDALFIYTVSIILYPIVVTDFFNKYLDRYDNRDNNNRFVKSSSNYKKNINSGLSKRSVLIIYWIVFFSFLIFCIPQIIFKTKLSDPINILNSILYYLIPMLVFYFLMDCNRLKILNFNKHFNLSIKKSSIMILFIVIAICFVVPQIYFKIGPDELNTGSLFTLKTIYLLIYSITFYLLGFLFPFYQNGMLPYPESYGINMMFFVFLAILIVLGCSIIYFYKRIKDKALRKKLVFGLLFFLINIIIVLHIIPIKGRVIVAERYSYMAYIGLIIILVLSYKYLIQKYSRNFKYFITTGLIALIIGYSIQSFCRSYVFKDSYSFWSDAIKKNSKNHYAIFSLGLYYFEKADYQTAIEKYNEAIKLNLENYEYYLNRGSSYFKVDSIELAITDYNKAMELNSGNYLTYKNRGVLYYETGNLANAMTDLEMCFKLNPNDDEIAELYDNVNYLWIEYNNYQSYGKSSSAISQYYLKLATDLAKKGKYNQSILFFNESIKFNNLNVDALKNRGNVFAILERFDESINDYEKALIINPSDAGLYMNLGNVLHQSGNLLLANENWHKALNLGNQDAKKMINQFCE